MVQSDCNHAVGLTYIVNRLETDVLFLAMTQLVQMTKQTHYWLRRTSSLAIILFTNLKLLLKKKTLLNRK